MKNLVINIFLLGSLLLSNGLFAQEELTLLQAQDYGVKNAYSVRSAQMDLELAKEKVKETTALGLPQINAEVAFQDFLQIPTVILPGDFSPTGESSTAQFGTKYNLNGSITASQLIFDGSYIIGLQAAKTYKELSVISIGKSEQEIKQTITDTYSLCLTARENERILSESIAVIEKSLRDSELLYENGFVEQQDVEQLELSIKSLENQLRYAQNQGSDVLQLLKFQMGLSQKAEIKLTSTIDDLVNEAVSSSLVDSPFSIDKNLDYQLAMTNKSLMDLGLRNNKTSYLPSLSGYFQYQQAAQRNQLKLFSSDEPWFPTTVWGLNLNIPIFSSGMRRSQVQQATIEVNRADLMLEQAREGAELELNTARNSMVYAMDNYQTSVESSELSKRIFDKTQIKYTEGISSSFELTQAKNQLLETQGQYVSAVLNLLNSANALNKALNNY